MGSGHGRESPTRGEELRSEAVRWLFWLSVVSPNESQDAPLKMATLKVDDCFLHHVLKLSSTCSVPPPPFAAIYLCCMYIHTQPVCMHTRRTPRIKTSVCRLIGIRECLTCPPFPPPFSVALALPQSAALNAVVADASTHVIRGTTVSVQWSRGAKDGGSGDRPRRRNSGTSNANSGNGNSSPRGGNRSSSKMGMFPHKSGVGGGGGGGGRAGGGGGGACGVGCSHGFSPMRSRGTGHLHASPAGGAGAGMPYGYGGAGHGDHHNQPMVSRACCLLRGFLFGYAGSPIVWGVVVFCEWSAMLRHWSSWHQQSLRGEQFFFFSSTQRGDFITLYVGESCAAQLCTQPPINAAVFRVLVDLSVEAPGSIQPDVCSMFRFKPLDPWDRSSTPLVLLLLFSLPPPPRFAWLCLRSGRPLWGSRLTRRTTYTPLARAHPGAALLRTLTSPRWRSQAEEGTGHTRFTRDHTLSP